MALINCPECKTEVSDKANHCPRCAFPLNINQVTNTKSQEGCFLQTLNAGCMFVAVLIGALMLFASLAGIFS